MHILKIIHGFPPHYNAGSEVYSQTICNELSKKHRVTVFTREENPYEPDFSLRHEVRHENLHVWYMNMARGKDGFRHATIDEKFASLLKNLNPDIAHIGHLNHLSTGLVEQLNRAGVPIVFTLHDFWLMCPRGQFLQRNFDGQNIHSLCHEQNDRKCADICYKMYHSGLSDYLTAFDDSTNWERWIQARMQETRLVADKVDLFIAPSRYLMNRFVKDFQLSPDKIIYLDYGFPLEYLKPVKKEPQPTYTFGYIGTHIPSKGIDLLIKAFQSLTESAALKIWGHKDAQSTKALMKMAESSHNPIEFAGEYINSELVSRIFPQVDCIVVPSVWGENSPLVIHEAQACHIPVITADFGGMKEYVKHHENGLLFRHRDYHSLAEQMEWALLNPGAMNDYGKRGYLYSPDGQVPEIGVHCEELMNLYTQTLESYEAQNLAINAGYQS